jgi:hypothetical protein
VLIDEYFLPMAAQAYGDAQPTARESNAAVLARWIVNTCPEELYPRHLQREVRLPGLRTAQQIREAAEALVASGWLCSPHRLRQFGPRPRHCYRVNPRLRLQSRIAP